MERLTIRNKQGEMLVGELQGELHKKLVIICHGLKGKKETEYLVLLADELERKGIPSFRFDFSGNGESEGDFSEATYHKEADDVQSVMDWFEQGRKASSFLLMGHSMGGGVVKAVAGRDPRVTGLVSLSGVTYPENYKQRYQEIFEKVKADGVAYWRQKTHGTEFKVTQAFFDSADTINLIGSAKNILCPVLIIHGGADPRVPVQESKDFLKALPREATYIELPGVDHLYDCHNENKERAFGLLVEAVIPWIEENY